MNEYPYELSLQVLSDNRKKLISDSKKLDAAIRIGLHNLSNSTADLYLQKYLVLWLDEHWNDMLATLNQYVEKGKLPVDDKKKVIKFFARNFKTFIDYFSMSDILVDFSHKMLIIKKNYLDEMLNYADKWEENNLQMEAELAKHKEQFEKRIEEIKKSGK